MSDYLMREFRAQLTTALDLVQRRSMFEIMKIFEGSLHDHQMELSQKEEEIAQLKMKLQRAEIRLTDSVCGVDRGTEAKDAHAAAAQREPENATGLTPAAEIDYEVPDDWCAPVGCENVPKQDEGFCPSVRLRQLSIPLWHIPIKQEAVNNAIDSFQRNMGHRKSLRVLTLKKKSKPALDKSLPTPDTRHLPLRNDVKGYLEDIKKEYTDQTASTVFGRGRRRRHLTGRDNRLRSRVKAAESKPTGQDTEGEDSGTLYPCKFCTKVFDTSFGRKVHVRSHKKCKGCKKKFPFPSALQNHKPHCRPFQIFLEKIAQSTIPPKPQSHVEEETIASSTEKVILRRKSASSRAQSTIPPKPQSHVEEETIASSIEKVILRRKSASSRECSESSPQGVGDTKRYTCALCNLKCRSNFVLKEHVRVHTGEKPFLCSMCPQRFRVNQLLKSHMMRRHKNLEGKPNETNGELASTKPLDTVEGNQEDSISPGKITNPVIKHNKTYKKPKEIWRTMGQRCPDGYVCRLCEKICKNSYRLIEHYRIHTGEKPIRCKTCPERFRTAVQLSVHKKQCKGTVTVIVCDHCDKQFSTQKRCDNHMVTYHRKYHLFCKVCGKGFLLKGRLKNHMEHCHKR